MPCRRVCADVVWTFRELGLEYRYGVCDSLKRKGIPEANGS